MASGCAAAECLSALYQLTGHHTQRGGANIPRRIEISARIASCSISLSKWPAHDVFVDGQAKGWAVEKVLELTRMNLRLMGVCASEASDLCTFFQHLACALGAGTQVLIHHKTTRQLILYVKSNRSPFFALGLVSCEQI